jgi:hypothetical protein
VLDGREGERRAPVLGVAGVEEVDVAGVVLRDVLEVRLGAHDGAVDRRLVLLGERERLGEAARLGRQQPPVGQPGHEVVLHRQRSVLARERGRRLARAGEADDQADPVAPRRRDDLAAGVQRQAAALVDQAVPHAQAALLGLAEVVRLEHARDAGLEVDGDEPVRRPALGFQVRRVDDRQLGRVRLVVEVEVELLLHARDVRVGGLDVQPRPGALGRIGADPALDQDHLLVGDVGVLDRRHALVVGARHDLVGADGLVGDQEGRALGPRQHACLHVHVADGGTARVRHLRREGLQPLGGRIAQHAPCTWQRERVDGHDGLLQAAAVAARGTMVRQTPPRGRAG